MKNPIRFSWKAAVPAARLAVMFVAGTSLAVCANAQRLRPVEFGSQPREFAQTSPEELRSIILEGRVLEPNGAPAAGVVVVSSAGGTAETNAEGMFRLVAETSRDAEFLRLTVFGRSSQKLVAGQQVTLTAGPGPIGTGTMQLSPAATCSSNWLPTFGEAQGVDESIDTMAVFDDGSGPCLFVGGRFNQAGGAVASRIAKWDGLTWESVGGGIAGNVYDLVVFDDGSGPALYAGGAFSSAGGGVASRVAKWDGTSWAALGAGVNQVVYSLGVYDDGSGSALYAGGDFWIAGGVAARGVAKWDGATWSEVGGGIDDRISDFETYDDGSGLALYATGSFTEAGGVPVNRIAKWDGSVWSPLGSGLASSGSASGADLEVFDGGSGAELCVIGTYTMAGGISANGIAKWNGATWSTMGTGLTGGFWGGGGYALSVHDDGGGVALYAGGSFQSAGGVAVDSVAKWDGTAWASLGTGVGSPASSFVEELVAFDDGTGAKIFAGGNFEQAGLLGAGGIAQWDGSTWAPLLIGPGTANSPVFALEIFDDGTGPALHVGGYFTTAGAVFASGVAKWDGSTWSALGGGVDGEVYTMTSYNDGSGEKLYVGGKFTSAGGVPANNVAVWDGTTWAPLGAGFETSAQKLFLFDDGSGPALHATGFYFDPIHVVSYGFLTKWDGTNWTTLGTVGGSLSDVVVYDDGSGPALYLGGAFGGAPGLPSTGGLVKWDGSTWSDLPTGSFGSGDIYTLAVYDDGSGESLYAGGLFTFAGGVQARRVAKWNSASGWSPLGAGFNSSVSDLVVYDDGSGPALYAGGSFTVSGGFALEGIAKWDNTAEWEQLGGGLNGVHVLLPFEGSLYAGGSFNSAADTGESYLARWATTPGCGPGAGFCFGDGTGTACPCGNNGASNEGCANSAGSGASLSGFGESSFAQDSFGLDVAGAPGSTIGLVLLGSNQMNQGLGVSVGSGLLCVGGTVKRSQLQVTTPWGTTTFLDFKGNPFGATAFGVGNPVTYQYWYRDSASSCSGGNFNFTNGWEAIWRE